MKYQPKTTEVSQPSLIFHATTCTPNARSFQNLTVKGPYLIIIADLCHVDMYYLLVITETANRPHYAHSILPAFKICLCLLDGAGHDVFLGKGFQGHAF